MAEKDNHPHLSRLHELLKSQGVAPEIPNVMDQAIKEINHELDLAKVGQVKTLLKEALDLKKQKEETDRQYAKQNKAWEKKMAKVLNRIQSMAKGQPPKDDDEEEEKEKKDGEEEESGE